MKQILDFKTDKIQVEWEDERLKDKIKHIAILLAFYSWHFFKKRLTITCIFRTQHEQDNIYKHNEKYKKKKWQSVHQYFRGIDLRTWELDDNEIKILLEIANTIPYDLNRPGKKTALYHDLGTGAHLHIQCMG